VGANKRKFLVQRKLGGGIVTESPEVMIPESILNTILASASSSLGFAAKQAFSELKKIMDTDI
jgi:hypothetical protein